MITSKQTRMVTGEARMIPEKVRMATKDARMEDRPGRMDIKEARMVTGEPRMASGEGRIRKRKPGWRSGRPGSRNSRRDASLPSVERRAGGGLASYEGFEEGAVGGGDAQELDSDLVLGRALADLVDHPAVGLQDPPLDGDGELHQRAE